MLFMQIQFLDGVFRTGVLIHELLCVHASAHVLEHPNTAVSAQRSQRRLYSLASWQWCSRQHPLGDR